VRQSMPVTMDILLLTRWITVLVVVTVCLAQVQGQALRYQARDAADTLTGSEPLTLLWGIPDSTAYVGKLYRFTIPPDAFQGNIVGYEVQTLFLLIFINSVLELLYYGASLKKIN